MPTFHSFHRKVSHEYSTCYFPDPHAELGFHHPGSEVQRTYDKRILPGTSDFQERLLLLAQEDPAYRTGILRMLLHRSPHFRCVAGNGLPSVLTTDDDTDRKVVDQCERKHSEITAFHGM